jgi:hypothetical protein
MSKQRMKLNQIENLKSNNHAKTQITNQSNPNSYNAGNVKS